MKASLIVLLAATCGAVLADIGGAPVTGSFEDCFNQDSISCLQLTAFRKAREFFGQKTIELVGGASLEKATDRSGKSSEDIIAEQQVESARDVQSRETAIEDYVIRGVTGFFQERSLSFNIGNAARSLMNNLPEEARSAVTDLMSEGRGKKKKALKALLPILMAIKFKVVLLSILGLFGVAIIAKKAILASLISLAISGFIGIKKLLASKGGDHEEIGGYHGGSSGWSAPSGGWDSGYGGGYGEHGSHSSPIAQHIAYSGQKPSRR